MIRIILIVIFFFVSYAGTAQCAFNTEVNKIEFKLTDNFPGESFNIKIITPDSTLSVYAIYAGGVWSANFYPGVLVKNVTIGFEKNGMEFEKLNGPIPITSGGTCAAEFTFKPYWSLTILGDQAFSMFFEDDPSIKKSDKFISGKKDATNTIGGRIFINENVPTKKLSSFNFQIELSQIIKKGVTKNSSDIARDLLREQKNQNPQILN